MLGTALIAAFLAGGWFLVTAWPLQLIAAIRQKDTPAHGIIIGLLHIWRFISDHPLAIGGLTGLLIGDFATGIEVGALIQLVFFGVFIVGAAVPPRPMVATIMAVIFASKLGAEHGAVLGMAVPIAVFSLMLFLSNISIMSFFYERFALQAAKTGDLKKLELWHAILQPINITVINAIPAFLGVYYGVPLVGKVLGAIPTWLSGGFGTMQGILPIAGFALLVYSMNPGSLILLFVAGFAIGTVTQLTPMATALVVIALIVFYMKTRSSQNSVESEVAAAGDAISKIPLSFSDRISLAWRNFMWYYNASFEVLGGWGFAYQLVPFLRKYKTDEERAEAMTRNIAFWNTNVYAGGVVPGMVAAMEAQRAENNETIDGSAIQALKVATMGPVAGIGDSLYHATLVPIILAIGTNMVLDGNSFGWFFSVFGLIALFAGSAFYLVGLGYNLGVDALSRMRGVIDTVAEGAKYVGLILVGTMVASLVKLNLDITYTTGEKVINLQQILDSIMPGLPILGLFFLTYWLLRKGVKPIWLIIGLMVVAILGTHLGLLAG